MCTSAVPQKQGPSFCTECPVLKLLEVVSFLVLELVEVFCVLLLLFIEHGGVLKEVLMGGMTTILHKQSTCMCTKRKTSYAGCLQLQIKTLRLKGAKQHAEGDGQGVQSSWSSAAHLAMYHSM